MSAIAESSLEMLVSKYLYSIPISYSLLLHLPFKIPSYFAIWNIRESKAGTFICPLHNRVLTLHFNTL